MFITPIFFVEITLLDFAFFIFSLPEYEELEWFAKVEDLMLSHVSDFET